MIVELIGCGGAGKTTLGRILRRHEIAGVRVVRMPDLVLDRAGLGRITHPTAVNIAQELGGLPFLLTAWRREREFMALARRILADHAPSTFDYLNGMRGLMRRVGMYHLAKARASNLVVLSDEGTLLFAYHLFVMTNLELGRRDLERFARLVPRPDAIVYVKASVASLVERAESRPDPRRQHVGKTRAEVERNVRRTVELFDLLVTTAPLRDLVVVVENEDGDQTRRERLAEQVAARLHDAVAASDAATGARQPQPQGLEPEFGQ